MILERKKLRQEQLMNIKEVDTQLTIKKERKLSADEAAIKI